MARLSTSYILLFCFQLLAVAIAFPQEPSSGFPSYPLSRAFGRRSENVTSHELDAAHKLVEEAVKQQGIYNDYIVSNPRRNTYTSRSGASKRRNVARKANRNAPAPPVLSDELRKATALVAEFHAKKNINSTVAQTPNRKRDTSYWLANMKQNGLAPMGSNSSFPVFRDVTHYGAKGDGLTDDTDAINAAIADGNNCGEGCMSSSVKGTLVYFPRGTYLISRPINAFYYSQLVGDANSVVTIKTAENFVGLGAIQTDVYIPGGSGAEWYIEQSNFYRQVRNLDINIEDTKTEKAAGLHWQVAQATSLTNVNIRASRDPKTTQMGMFTENGSGGFMSFVNIIGGKYGIYGGNQQYTVREFIISQQTAACICLLWDWGWTWSNLQLSSAPVGIMLLNPEDNNGQPAGSTFVMDSYFFDLQYGIQAKFMKKTILDTSIITLQNIVGHSVKTMVGFTDGNQLDIPSDFVDVVVIGNVHQDTNEYGLFHVDVTPPADSLLEGGGGGLRKTYFRQQRPQYRDVDAGSFINVKDHGAQGDGHTDDTAAIAAAVAMATSSNVIYFPAGSYIITSTITLPKTIRMTGQVWSQLVASGSFFADMMNPKPMIRVGEPGDAGTVEISDMLFTSVGALPGLILMQWNVQAERQGSVGMYDAHFRVGGAYGSKLQVADCPKVASIPDACIAASMMLHLTPQSNGYFENVWAWVADHDIDDAQNTMVTVAAARGILVESATGPTWLYGTASEHSMLYQYNFNNASNIFAGMIQTESPYFQGTSATTSPGPFGKSIGVFNNDPNFKDDSCNGTSLLCDVSWAVMVKDVSNMTIAGAGLYSWFDAYDQSTCVDGQNCQQRLINTQEGNSAFWLWNLITVGATEMVSDTENQVTVSAKEYTQAHMHPYWSALAFYGDDSITQDQTCSDEDDDQIPEHCIGDPVCDMTRTFGSMDDLLKAADSIEEECLNSYAIDVLRKSLNDDLAHFNDVNNGYDGLFGYYIEYVKNMIPGVLQSLLGSGIGGPGSCDKYFECKFEQPNDDPIVGPCPMDWLDYYPGSTWTFTYKLINSTGFFDEIRTKYGIEESYIDFSGRIDTDDYDKDTGIGLDTHVVGLPHMKEDIKVKNPKETVQKVLDNIGPLKDALTNRQIDLVSQSWDGEADDVLQTLSMPVFMLAQAVDNMAEVKDIAQKQKDIDETEFIKKILTIVLLLIPFVQDVLPEIAAADIIFNIINIGGNIAMAIKNIIDAPESAPMEILGLLTLGKAKTKEDFAPLAAARKGVGSDAKLTIGKTFNKLDEQFQKVVNKECKL